MSGYWIDRGRFYEKRFRPSVIYRAQEDALRHIVATIQPKSILELGCGFGRMTALLHELRPESYVAVDISPDQLAIARSRIAGVEFVQADVTDLSVDEKFDLVFSSELLMHISPGEVGKLVKDTIAWSNRYVLNIDLANWAGPLANHNWVHDYHRLYAPYRPEMIPIGNQAMFVVDKELS